MNTIFKSVIGSAAVGAMAFASAVPAQAQQRHDNDRDRGGISAGEIIAGALIIGGIAAVASSVGNNRNDRYDDRRYNNGRNGRYDGRYDNGNPRRAVEQCVNYAQNQARRNVRGGAEVTDIREIDRKRDGYTIKGRIAVNKQNRSWRQGDNRYGQGWGNDYRGWNQNRAGWDSGKFTCQVRNGRVTNVNFSGIRGL